MLSLNLYDSFRSFCAVKLIDFVRFEDLIDHILLDIGYWNHMDLPVQKASITVSDVMDVPLQEGMFGKYGVFKLMYMKHLVSGQSIGIPTTSVSVATQFGRLTELAGDGDKWRERFTEGGDDGGGQRFVSALSLSSYLCVYF
ncbi:unnamed protein product [Lactuca saligna]|uniref:Uncharacterized protein n=1 Tax=Lactuca saligna TaxID=75948 RepID=A0AA35ZTN2_LACSI|nr:unnamed protein product [Lactuca saligna]